MQQKAGKLFYVFLIIFILLVMFPFIWIFLTSLKPVGELYGDNAFKFNLDSANITNYIRVFTVYPFLRYLWNSTAVAVLTTFYSLVIASFAAYAIARLHFKGKSIFLGILLAVSMFPQIATISPIFLFMQSVGLRNTYSGLIIPYTTFALPLAVWYMTTFFKKIPYDLEEAAKMDGASVLQTFGKVILPLAVPGLFTTALVVFIHAWHEFFFALTINTKQSMMTVPVGIALFRGEYEFPWGEISAATIVVTIPILLLVLVFQKRIVSGLTSGAVKE